MRRGSGRTGGLGLEEEVGARVQRHLAALLGDGCARRMCVILRGKAGEKRRACENGWTQGVAMLSHAGCESMTRIESARAQVRMNRLMIAH